MYIYAYVYYMYTLYVYLILIRGEGAVVPILSVALQVSRMGSSGQSLDTSGLGPQTRGGGSSQVVRTQ